MEEVSEKQLNKQVIQIVNEYLKPNTSAANKRGEVFTPLNLIREMLFGIRKSKIDTKKVSIHMDEYMENIWGIDKNGLCIEDKETDRIGGIGKEIWENKNSTFLDPSSGIGNFLIIIYYKLMYSLRNKIKNDNERSYHILTNMLYMIELDGENVKKCKNLFNMISSQKNVKINILNTNTLNLTKEMLMKQFGKDSFTVIVGNPPYQQGGVKTKGNTTKYETIWTQFIKGNSIFPGSLGLLKKSGILCAIHPSSWLHNDRQGMHDVILSHKLHMLRIFTSAQANTIFSSGGAVRVAYYILEKDETINKYYIMDINNNIEEITQTKNNIYQSYNLILSTIYKKCKNIGMTGYIKSAGKVLPKNSIISSTGKYKYISAHKEDGIYTCKNDKKFVYQNSPKIILKGSSKLYHYEDYIGEYGVYGNWGYYIIDDNVSNLKRYAKFLDTKLAKIIMESTKEDQNFIEPKYLLDIFDIPKSIEMTDIGLQKYFKYPIKDIERSNLTYNNNEHIVKKTAKKRVHMKNITRKKRGDI